MKRIILSLLMCVVSVLSIQSQKKNEYPADYAGNKPRFSALIYYSEHVEIAHRQFAEQAVEFFHKLSYGEGFTMKVVKSMDDFDRVEKLQPYDVVIMLNNMPGSPAARRAFEEYMEHGGAWMGFHAAAYNDKNTHWPWLNKFLGCGKFYCNNWPPQSVLLEVDSRRHDIVRNVPRQFVSAPSEWYMWDPSPRKSKNVEVLLSLSKKNYPLGVKDIVKFGDFPIAWTNHDYRMVYFNFGHGDESFTSVEQNLLLVNALTWLTRKTK